MTSNRISDLLKPVADTSVEPDIYTDGAEFTSFPASVNVSRSKLRDKMDMDSSYFIPGKIVNSSEIDKLEESDDLIPEDTSSERNETISHLEDEDDTNDNDIPISQIFENDRIKLEQQLSNIQNSTPSFTTTKESYSNNLLKKKAVSSQLKLFDISLDIRIRFQHILEIFNNNSIDNFSDTDTYSSLINLLSSLYNIQILLSNQSSSLYSLKTIENIDSIPVTNLLNIFSSNYEKFDVERDKILNKWSKRVNINSTSSSNNKNFTLKALNQNIINQIKDVLQDKERLISRAKKRKISNVENDSDDFYDDSDFYQQLLRECMNSEYSNSMVNNRENLIAQMASIKKNKKKQVERKASKGRKIRYVIQDKLVNFFTPIIKHNEEFPYETLFQNLFGKS